MKKYLLPESGNFYKANLHCHTVISDGCLTPEEIKAAYKAKGYSAVAFTDHNVLIPHNDLTDDSFIALNGLEVNINEEGLSTYYRRTCHVCLVSLTPDAPPQPFFAGENYLYGNCPKYASQVNPDPETLNEVREYTVPCVNKLLQRGRELGFFVTYNHPTWSREATETFVQYHGMHAMEVFNNECYRRHGQEDINTKEYDAILRGGERIYCIGTDDNHNKVPLSDPESASFGAFTMIKAEKLQYEALTDALLNGNFYASQGPEIRELFFEDGFVTIRTSEVDRIVMKTPYRAAKVKYAAEGESLNEVTFEVNPEWEYIRFTVKDKFGKLACTNAYFIDELLDK